MGNLPLKHIFNQCIEVTETKMVLSLRQSILQGTLETKLSQLTELQLKLEQQPILLKRGSTLSPKETSDAEPSFRYTFDLRLLRNMLRTIDKEVASILELMKDSSDLSEAR